jgi:transposase
MQLHTIGIDLGKTVFHLVGLNPRGEVVVRKKFSRKQLLLFTANLQVELIGMEACGGSHFLGRALREQGHEVRLMPAQYVKPYVKTNKSDYIDAEAIAEAVGRPKMRFVPIKSDDQLDLQSLHRVRERWVMRRTAVINQIRGLLLERGITVRKGRRHIDAALPGILEDASNQLSGALRVLLVQLKLELDHLQMRIDEVDATINKAAGENEVCRRLVAIPGIGPGVPARAALSLRSAIPRRPPDRSKMKAGWQYRPATASVRISWAAESCSALPVQPSERWSCPGRCRWMRYAWR